MPSVRFVNEAIAVEAPEGTTVLSAALSRGVRIGHTCGGEGSCSTCRVAVIAGAGNLSPINIKEIANCLAPGERLACQARLRGDVTVRVLEVPPADLT
jgi:ferredoxin